MGEVAKTVLSCGGDGDSSPGLHIDNEDNLSLASGSDEGSDDGLNLVQCSVSF